MSERLYTRLAQAFIAFVVLVGAMYAEPAHSSGCAASPPTATTEAGR